MDLNNPQDSGAHSRRGFLRVAGAAGGVAAAAAVGASSTGRAEPAINNDGEFTDDPFTLGIASGDPLADSVVLWTRLAPTPFERGGGMPKETVTVEWTIATDEDIDDAVQSGTVPASPENGHAVHIDVTGLESNTEYYYQFEAGGHRSTVGRTKTLPIAEDDIEEFTFAFASCQNYPDGFYTAYEHMVEEDLDLVVFLGDYLYEYGINANAGARETWIPQEFRTETVTPERYRLQYALYKSDPNLQAAHAQFPWIVTWDDHEVDNDYADEDPQDPEEQPTYDFLKRRANAYDVYFEHMPIRPSRDAQGPVLPLYRNFEVGDLAEINVLDTRQYRSDIVEGEGPEDAEDTDQSERLNDDRRLLGERQQDWLVENLRGSEATWDILANQVLMAEGDFAPGAPEEFSMDKWDGYVEARETIFDVFEQDVQNPIVITGDFHRNFANNLKADFDDPSSATLGTEFLGTSISSGGDGVAMDEFGETALAENDHIKYTNNQRGYVRCTVTPEQWQTDFRLLPYVEQPGAPIETDASFIISEGTPGIQETD